MRRRIGRPTTKATQRGQRGAGDDSEPRRQAEMGRPDGDRVGADAEEAGVAEADLAGEAHQQVEAEQASALTNTSAATR